MYLIHRLKKKIDGENFENLPLNMDFLSRKTSYLKSIFIISLYLGMGKQIPL